MDKSQASHLQRGERCPKKCDWNRYSPYKQGLAHTWVLHMGAASRGPQSSSVDAMGLMWLFCLIPNRCCGVLSLEDQRKLFSWALWCLGWASAGW